MADTSQPQAARVVAHLWNGSVDGHNCQDCAWDSIWRCDPTAHLLPFTPTIGVRLRSMLRRSSRARRTTPIPNRRLS